MGGSMSSDKTPPRSYFVLDPSISKTTPDYIDGKLSADPHYGFEGKKRKERVMVATHEELESAKVPPKFRDYCAHGWIALEKCKKDEFPFLYRCHHIRHEYDHCQMEDYLIRMKEYERERRLLHRKARKEAKAQRAAAAVAED